MNILRSASLAPICLLAAPLIFMSTASAADIWSEVPPPPSREQHAPPPRDGYVWGSGHWAWSGSTYYWVDGRWIVQRRHFDWVPDVWEQAGEKWRLVQGHWRPTP
jgi:hypothetical protein